MLSELGQSAFGENVVQEALPKIAETANLGLEWHFIGPIQSNKTRDIAAHFAWAQGVAREKTLKRLADQRDPDLPPLNVCIQVNIDREPQKSGADPDDVERLADIATGLPGLRLRGLMAIPRLDQEAGGDNSFRRMHSLYRSLAGRGFELDTLSMGMSGDLEAAIAEGSTMVRVGTDLFGPRPG
jgi:pyridoxal phosphate enzyme (YggS family)